LNPDFEYLIALKAIPNIGDVLARRFVEYFGSAKSIFDLSLKELKLVPGISDKNAQLIVNHRKNALELAAKEMEFIAEKNFSCYSCFDDDYPARLKHCVDAPLFVFYKGSVKPESKFMVAVVGTRKASIYGRKMTEKLIEGLQMQGITVVSGLAYGIDTYAHQAAVDYGIPTIGVLGHGFRFLYPEENVKLATKMLENGGLITEFVSTEKPEKAHFPVRNRIIAGMVDAVVVVEAQSKGGALITAEVANSYSRDVFAFPGRVEDQKSRGCNWLIRTNRASLIESAEHLMYAMNWSSSIDTAYKQVRMEMLADENAKAVYDYLFEHESAQIDEICNALNLSINTAAMVLLSLEFNGVVAALPGKIYHLKNV
jgi:DNA processing protein